MAFSSGDVEVEVSSLSGLGGRVDGWMTGKRLAGGCVRLPRLKVHMRLLEASL